MDLHKYGPWAVVTGASAGLGEQFALQLAEQGMNLFLTARREDRLVSLARTLRDSTGVQVKILPLDLAAPGAPEALDRATEDLDVGLLVNNAGFGAMGRFLDQDLERLTEMIRLNCLTVTELAHRFGRRLRARGRGGMIVVASLAGFQATPYMALYGATKGFDLLLGEALHHEWKDSKVDVLVLNPGSTRTEFGSVSGSAGGGYSMKAPGVVAAALRSLGRKASIVTGAHNKAVALLGRALPRRTIVRLGAWTLKRMTPPERR
ncbi:MAG: SDR family NAD(P)-dependent oxidoreductase [Acidobacteriota bacterium]